MGEKIFEKVPFLGGIADEQTLDVAEGKEGFPPHVLIVDGNFNLKPGILTDQLPAGSEFYIRHRDDDLDDWEYRAHVADS